MSEENFSPLILQKKKSLQIIDEEQH